MTILFRYLLREYVKVFLMCFASLMTVYLVVDFFEKVRRFIRFDAEALHTLGYFLLRTPAISFQIAPLAILMATLLTLGMFSKNHEITAMRSCGISLARTAMPFLLFSLTVAVCLFGLSAIVIPLSTARAEYVKTTLIEKKSATAAIKSLRPWLQIENQTLMNVEAIEPNGATLRGVHLYQLGPDFRLKEITEAQEVRYTADGWVMQAGLRRILQPNGGIRTETFLTQPLALSHEPQDFTNWLSVETDERSLMDLRSRIARLEKDGYQVARLLTDFHGRIAFPFVSVVMAVVGIALSLRRSGTRGGGMAIGIGQALVIGFLYWTAHSVAIAFGRSGALDPVVAGWIANLLFLSFGTYLFLKVSH
ncbi:MAG TPA: LPS export ABC transporter permease LptG [Nitrospiraceae bacterium]|nr:LPS export ABC transporter permease LptG [Nitrospiraceae bacterium]